MCRVSGKGCCVAKKGSGSFINLITDRKILRAVDRVPNFSSNEQSWAWEDPLASTCTDKLPSTLQNEESFSSSKPIKTSNFATPDQTQKSHVTRNRTISFHWRCYLIHANQNQSPRAGLISSSFIVCLEIKV